MNQQFDITQKGRDAADKFFDEEAEKIRTKVCSHQQVYLLESMYPVVCFWVETEKGNIQPEFDRILRQYPDPQPMIRTLNDRLKQLRKINYR